MKNSLLFIPDISGFTSFVTDTEIKHSRHIVSDLLELIIDSDELKLSVSEVEGDAVLFYKFEEVPAFEEICRQSEKTFSLFHQYLQQYEYERICRCGACSTAINLSLKFVVHVGELEHIKIKNHNKLHGKSVILVHRLLKNDVSEKEYLLWTKESFKNVNLKEGVKVESLSSNYENYGDIAYEFISLEEMLEKQKRKIVLPNHMGNVKVSSSQLFNMDISYLYEMVTDFEKRLSWSKRVREILTPEDEDLVKSGNFHTCVIGNNRLNIESVGRIEKNGEIIYAERLNDFKFFKEVLTFYIFRKKGNKTELTIENSFQLKRKWMCVLNVMIKRQLRRSAVDTFKELAVLENS